MALFDGYGDLLMKFVKARGIYFLETDGERECVGIESNGTTIKLYVNHYDNLKVIEEIFIDRLYDITTDGEYVVCDVGMNVAAASLYFAGMSNIKKLYGFEPFENTFKMASENICLNRDLAPKIIAHNYGVGKEDGSLHVPLPVQGALGGSTTSEFLEKTIAAEASNMISVKIRDIKTIIEEVRMENPGIGIILKLDCEGAEYEILERMADADLISQVDIYMIEYHFKGKSSLQKILTKKNFLVMSPGDDTVSPFGMLYAINPEFGRGN